MARIWLWTLFVAATLVCGCGTGNKRMSSALPPDVELTITDDALSQGLCDTLQLGRMRQGEIIAKTIRLHNGEQQPIVIIREATSCGCTTAQYVRQPIKPDTSCDITIEFNSQGQMGWQMKLMEFYFAEKSSPLKIYIDADVE